MKKILGIDLGTTYSCIAYVDEYQKPIILQNIDGNLTTPSVVFFDEDEVIVGEVAKESAKLYPEKVVSFIKRSMGDPDFLFEHNGEDYFPEIISSLILKKVVKDAEERLGETISDAVITCPAYFGISEREATKLAGELAGLNVRQILNEPTAAAIFYGLAEVQERKVILVYDLGGGTFDITMIEITAEKIQVICTGGDHHLGGKDWDDAIVRYLVEEFQSQTGLEDDILDDYSTWQDMQNNAEKAKKMISTRKKAPVTVNHQGHRAKMEITREKFEEITQDLLERTIQLTHDMLTEAREKGYLAFDEIILAGGSTRMPQVTERIKQEFSIEPKVNEPDEAVAKGAALYAYKLSINDALIEKIAQAENRDIEEVEATFSDIDEEVISKVTQEVAEEEGIAVNEIKNFQRDIENVASKSFGMVAMDGMVERVFNLVIKNNKVPAKVNKDFGTLVANQESVKVRIMENEVKDDVLELDIAKEIGDGILKLPSNLPANSPINVTFELNEEGRLNITAIETTQGGKLEVIVETSGVLHGEKLEEARKKVQGLIVT